MSVTIIDSGSGNLRSVANAFEALDCAASIVDDPACLATADRIVLPGVGAFREGMQKLQRAGWIAALETEVRERGKPFLGICLGMQLLATTGTEDGICAGLGWIPGVVEPLPETDSTVRVPHIGWNDVTFDKTEGLYWGQGNSQVYYFLHSYVLRPTDAGIVSGFCSHGTTFAASIQVGNIVATQYHPEKSQRAGLAVLKNFLTLLD